MNATVQFKARANKDDQSAAKQSFIFVPTAALRDKDGAKFVFLAFNGKAVRRDVHVQGQRTGGYLVDSLVGGESVITTAPSNLENGQKIRIVNMASQGQS